ncbi:MAG: shikimate dehydrogenase [Pseudomonadota bacterium]
MTDKYAVIGNPIAHSKSPQIHKIFAEQTGQDISYEAILAPLDGFAATVERLRKEGYKGCNVTVPFKHEVFNIATELSARAQAAQAVNTLKFTNNTIFGDNTDGIGLVRDVTQNLKYEIAGKRVLLMGTGGAAVGVAFLLSSHPIEICIAYRTDEKAQIITERIKSAPETLATSVTSSSYPGLSIIRPRTPNNLSYKELNRDNQARNSNSDFLDRPFDLVINATSAGLKNEMPDIPKTIFAPGALAYDMMYGKETPFMKFARANGAAIVADGLGMLVEQAAESFFIWRGVRPETAPVIAKLRTQQ